MRAALNHGCPGGVQGCFFSKNGSCRTIGRNLPAQTWMSTRACDFLHTRVTPSAWFGHCRGTGTVVGFKREDSSPFVGIPVQSKKF